MTECSLLLQPAVTYNSTFNSCETMTLEIIHKTNKDKCNQAVVIETNIF